LITCHFTYRTWRRCESARSFEEGRVDIEDPGDEIGPEAPGSKNMALWFHDPDGYRWELSVLGGK
jgi:hypothetical protein